MAAMRGFVTNVAQFKDIGLRHVPRTVVTFILTGVVTLVDTNRKLIVLQDTTGAVALKLPNNDTSLRPGQMALFEGTNCCPDYAFFPDYPYRPAGSDVRASFEAPMNWGEYHLTRMHGFLHPPVTGEYTFWIASDNSSELWLSTDAHASKARKVASVARFEWTLPRQWSRFPSQRSESVFLKAGESYYIEALAEQTTGGENLAVAWQGPTITQSVIDGIYLTPGEAFVGGTNGLLREYWTNYLAGDLKDLVGPRPFDSALSAQKVLARVIGPAELPPAKRIPLDQPIEKSNNYSWVEVQGQVQFVGVDDAGTFLELSDGGAQTQVRLPGLNPALSRRIHAANVRVQGVCEGIYTGSGVFLPGLIWASATNRLVITETPDTNLDTAKLLERLPESLAHTNPAMHGFYTTRGVVTFADRVFGRDYLFVQEEASPVLVSNETVNLKGRLKVGDWVDLGGALQTGESISALVPLVAGVVGIHAMPSPLLEPLQRSSLANREGRWSELDGVVHSVNTNGTLLIATRDGPAYLWVGETSPEVLGQYVDARLRARGALLLATLDSPLLLVPGRAFVDVAEEPPDNNLPTPVHSIADVIRDNSGSLLSHRVRVRGTITYRDAVSFFLEDDSGGIRVQGAPPANASVGQAVEVRAFPRINGADRTLTGAEVHPVNQTASIQAKALDLHEAMSSKQSDVLVQVEATLLSQTVNDTEQTLELQEQRRVFAATLANAAGRLPKIEPGSRLQVIGVCDNGATSTPRAGQTVPSLSALASLNLLLRSPTDIKMLSGPPWWTWKRTASLVGALLTVLAITLLWVHLLRGRLERQQAAQVAFSRLVLEQIEDERRRIAVNLHDSLGQTLLAIKNQALLAIHRQPDEQGMRRRLDEISGVTSQAIEEVRQITHGLRPYQLDRLGLTQAIRTSIATMSASGSILFAVRVEDIDCLFDKDSEFHFYRILQEAVTNVVKHSGATETAVVIKKRAAVVSLSIRDNGRGFDPSAVPSQAQFLGFGLNGIAERVRILGGKLAIESRPGQGTNLTAEVPLLIRHYDNGSNSVDRG